MSNKKLSQNNLREAYVVPTSNVPHFAPSDFYEMEFDEDAEHTRWQIQRNIEKEWRA